LPNPTKLDSIEGAVTGQLGPLGSEKDTLDAIDRASDEMREIAQRWQDRATVEGHTIAENYAVGSVSLVCNLHIPNGQSRGCGRGDLCGEPIRQS
jgi:hypothetical protein